MPEYEVVDGLPTALATYAAGFEGRYAGGVRDAVIVLDMAAYSDLVSVEEMSEYTTHLNGWTGVPQLRAALPHMRENSWSPREVDTRLVWEIDAELPRLRCNTPMFDLSGAHIGTPDLLDEEAGIVIEYDSDLHLERQRRHADRDRDDRYRALGLAVVVVLGPDLQDRDALAVRFCRARRNASFAPPSRRGWTVEPPPWWIPTATVAQRRALNDKDRHRLLKYRRTVA